MEIKDAELLRLKPGDVLHVKVSGTPAFEALELVRRDVKSVVPEGVEVLVSDSTVEMQVVRPDAKTETAIPKPGEPYQWEPTPERPPHCTRQRMKPFIDNCECEWCEHINNAWMRRENARDGAGATATVEDDNG